MHFAQNSRAQSGSTDSLPLYCAARRGVDRGRIAHGTRLPACAPILSHFIQEVVSDGDKEGCSQEGRSQEGRQEDHVGQEVRRLLQEVVPADNDTPRPRPGNKQAGARGGVGGML